MFSGDLLPLWYLAGFGTAYSPQSQGLWNTNQVVIEGLQHYLHCVYKDWDEHLTAVEFAYNHQVQPSLGPYLPLLSFFTGSIPVLPSC